MRWVETPRSPFKIVPNLFGRHRERSGGKMMHLPRNDELFLGNGLRFQPLKPIRIQHPPGDFLIDTWRDFLFKGPDQRPVFERAAWRPRWGQIIREVSKSYAIRSKCQTYEIVETLLRKTMIAAKCTEPQWHDRILFVIS